MIGDVVGLWWENITGPKMLVEEIAFHLSEGKNVVLQLDGRLPWQEQVRDLVMHQLERARLALLEWEGGEERSEIVPRLLKRLHRNELAACPDDYEAQVAYLKNERVFGNMIVWLLPVEDKEQLSLVRFLSDYRGKDLEKHGAFVAEIAAEQYLPQLSGRTVVVRSKDYIRHGDLLLYANILADSERKFPAEQKGYIACVAANLAGKNAELIPGILEEIDFENENPADALFRLWEQGYITCPDVMPDRQEVDRRLWEAQLQSAFAGIEIERLRITGEYTADIEEAIRTEYWDSQKGKSGYIVQHGEELQGASDVELGTLVRMMSLRRNDDKRQYLLYFPEEELRDWIIFLTDCRNSLAHHKVCTPAQICRLMYYMKNSE